MERVSVTVARRLALRGWAVKVVFPRSPNDLPLLAWCREQGVDAETHRAVLPVTAPHTFRDILALRRFIQACKPDVVNLHYGNNFISFKDVLALRLAGNYYCVVSVHHPTPWEGMGKRKPLMTRLAAYLADAIVVNSRATGDILREAKVPAAKLRHVACGIRVPTCSPDRSEARARLGLPLNAFVVSTLCRLEKHKGVGDLLEAVARIPDPDEEIMVVVGGDGPERTALQERANASLGRRAVFLGRIPDTADLYAATDIFALPSYMEGFGLVYIEAAMHGVPSIGTDVGGVPDAIVDGETGLLVPPGDPSTLATAIQRLYDDSALRLRMGDAARERAYAQFTDDRMADGYARVFTSH